jgi:phosphohistidine phosphatase
MSNVLLVSHQPLVGNLLGFLQHGHQRQPQPMTLPAWRNWRRVPLAGLMSLVSVKNP